MKLSIVRPLCLAIINLTIVSPLHSRFMDLAMMVEPQVKGPCISSLLGPPTKGCMQWLANVKAAATWEKSRRLVFLGSGDEFLHIVDENGQPLYDLSTTGRVITDSLFNQDRTKFFIGTDKGVIYGIDSFTFKPEFSFTADSEINNNLLLLNDLIFTSALGTIYCLDPNDGKLKWHIEQPLTVDRLRLASNSNIIPYGEGEPSHVLVPHAEGYVSLVDIKAGTVEKKIVLGMSRSSKFLDVVAPMVWLKNHLWVASYGLGIFAVDIHTGRVRHSVLENGILQLTSDGDKLFAASADTIFSIKNSGDINWKSPLNEIKSRVPRAAFPFNKMDRGAKRMFYGAPSRLLLIGNKLITAFSAGSIGVFNQTSGKLEDILGNSVGFNASVNWADGNILMVSKRGLLMKFHVVPGLVNP